MRSQRHGQIASIRTARAIIHTPLWVSTSSGQESSNWFSAVLVSVRFCGWLAHHYKAAVMLEEGYIVKSLRAGK